MNTLSSTHITFASTLGHMNVWGINQPKNDMYGVTNMTYLHVDNSNKTLTFQYGSAFFKNLYVDVNGSIFVEKDLVTTDGNMTIQFNGGDMHLSPNVDIIANNGDLIIDSIFSYINSKKLA